MQEGAYVIEKVPFMLWGTCFFFPGKFMHRTSHINTNNNNKKVFDSNQSATVVATVALSFTW